MVMAGVAPRVPACSRNCMEAATSWEHCPFHLHQEQGQQQLGQERQHQGRQMQQQRQEMQQQGQEQQEQKQRE